MLYSIVKCAVKLYLMFRYRIKVKGLENIPKGGAVLAANHLSNWDPVVLVVSCPRKVSFMAKAELFSSKLGKWFFTNTDMIPVKREVADLNAVKTSIKYLKDGKLLGIFVEGRRVKEGEDSEAKGGVAMLAIKAKKPVVPVCIESSFKTFSKINVIYGKPIDLLNNVEGKLTSDDYKELGGMVLDKIRSLKKEGTINGDHSS
ncbi:lysophospholipid acyltransferase family protein [Clostridium cylindrosporum]|uniref:1-acylglycerol-3-phosphate O-acyltransferase n=1 Tax=Clostridium cylindrosporum DSM 605 TaxID=1121307 RepID=A0A0J8D6A7_CLOCY|nr:lysophospholipid acyltransferase family protein [Clostridium cylindrosporum]KMT21387.1 1-acylglycerol-3-phosphate O-acyltransferase [Clostridium cylindrosporum DSM 605]